MYDKFMVFDVESIGLHGDAFAYGYVVVDRDGNELDCGQNCMNPNHARGTADDRVWVSGNIPTLPHTIGTGGDLRSLFWGDWTYWRQKGAVLACDCAWPVEAKFLLECVRDDHWRSSVAPYPLLDVSGFILAAGGDPTACFNRRENELPAHHPLRDARQSARLLLEALNAIRDNRVFDPS